MARTYGRGLRASVAARSLVPGDPECGHEVAPAEFRPITPVDAARSTCQPGAGDQPAHSVASHAGRKRCVWRVPLEPEAHHREVARCEISSQRRRKTRRGVASDALAARREDLRRVAHHGGRAGLAGSSSNNVAGPDSIRGFNFQHTRALHAALDLLESPDLQTLEVEGDDDVIDFSSCWTVPGSGE
jgi:hypothetical protein